MGRDAVVLIPRYELTPGKTYTVSLTVSEVDYVWSFTIFASAQLRWQPTHSLYVEPERDTDLFIDFKIILRYLSILLKGSETAPRQGGLIFKRDTGTAR